VTDCPTGSPPRPKPASVVQTSQWPESRLWGKVSASQRFCVLEGQHVHEDTFVAHVVWTSDVKTLAYTVIPPQPSTISLPLWSSVPTSQPRPSHRSSSLSYHASAPHMHSAINYRRSHFHNRQRSSRGRRETGSTLDTTRGSVRVQDGDLHATPGTGTAAGDTRAVHRPERVCESRSCTTISGRKARAATDVAASQVRCTYTRGVTMGHWGALWQVWLGRH
jgi:hypothetical protein